VVVRGTVLQAYASRATPLRDVLHALGPALHDVAVDVEAVLADLDQPSDLAR
jgi:CTP:molybdopterin cytidylyltransferase MocA